MISTAATMVYAVLTTFECCQFIIKVEEVTVVIACIHSGWLMLYTSIILLIIYYSSLLIDEVIKCSKWISLKISTNFSCSSLQLIVGKRDYSSCARHNQFVPWSRHYSGGKQNWFAKKYCLYFVLFPKIKFFKFPLIFQFSWVNSLSKRKIAFQLLLAVYLRLIGLYFLMYDQNEH